MPRREHSSEIESPKANRKLPAPLRIARGVGVTALSLAVGLFGAGAAVTASTEPPPAQPMVRVYDPQIVWTDNPIKTATQKADNPVLEQDCLDSDFISIDFSGTGLETSFYAAGIKDGINKNIEVVQPSANRETITKQLVGCSLYLVYGERYNEQANAEAIEQAVERFTPAGQKKPVIFRGASFGSIAAVRTSVNPTIKNSPVIDLRGIIGESPLTGMSDVSYDLFGIPVKDIADHVDLNSLPDFITYNHLPVIASDINSQNELGILWSEKGMNDGWNNTRKTWPPLMWSELAEIKIGMGTGNPDLPFVAIAAPSSDNTVNGSRANLELADKFKNFKFIRVPGLPPHASGWLSYTQPEYTDPYREATKWILGFPAK